METIENNQITQLQSYHNHYEEEKKAESSFERMLKALSVSVWEASVGLQWKQK